MNLPTTEGPSRGLTEISPEAAMPIRTKIAAVLAFLAFFIFLPVVNCNFVNYDDDVFVTNNPKVAAGLTWEGIKWAFTSADIDYWRPVSWLSHMLDIELFGAVAGGHHLTSLIIHCAAVVMAFLALERLTRAIWPSAVVAALFAWHPLHVESVAWIAERKDVLCGLFWFYTLWAYARYVEVPTPRRYLTMLAGFVLGVMSKPMIVTLPCVLLLLDYWPLRRIATGNTPSQRGNFAVPWWLLLKEKLPLFAVVLVVSFSTIYSQHHVGAIVKLESHSGTFRLQNSLGSYGVYVAQTLLPSGLCVFYPIDKLEPWQWGTSGLLIFGGLAAALYWAKRFPFLLVGWLWFLGVLVPVIGILQVGDQAHADRYTYLPLTGIFIIFVWTGWQWTGDQQRRRRSFGLCFLVVLATCAVHTRSQLSHWADSVTLFRRAATVTSGNTMAMNNLAGELNALGQPREAISYLQEALRIEHRQLPRFNLATAYSLTGDIKRAEFEMTRAFQMDPKSRYATKQMESLYDSVQKAPHLTMLRKFLAIGYAAKSDYVAASEQLSEVIRITPDDIEARVDQAAYLALAGLEIRAIAALKEALRYAPAHAIAHSNLGALLTKQGHVQEAILHHQAALAAQPNNRDSRYNYALLLARTGRIKDAKGEFEIVLRQNPTHLPSLQQLAWLLATNETLRDGPTALRLADEMMSLARTHTAVHLNVLAAAAAAAGHYEKASEIAQKALELARRDSQIALVEALPFRLSLYQSGRPYTQSESAK